jgi:isocitrate dehydrogenase
MHGDQTGEELLQDALRVLDPQVIGLNLNFQDFDLSLKNRQDTNNDVVRQAAAAMKQSGLGLKAATITPTKANSVGSPNAILREEIDGTVILRVGRRIPGVRPVGGVHDPISIVRMAVDDAYGGRNRRLNHRRAHRRDDIRHHPSGAFHPLQLTLTRLALPNGENLF